VSIGRPVNAGIDARIPTEIPSIYLPDIIRDQIYTCVGTGMMATYYYNGGSPVWDSYYNYVGVQMILNDGSRWGFGSNWYGPLDNSGLPGYERTNTPIKWNTPILMNGSKIKVEVL
jgi:hypothetical protein